MISITRMVTGTLGKLRTLLGTPDGRRKLPRYPTFRALGEAVPFIGVETPDGIVFASTRDRIVGRSVFVHRGWERDGLTRALAVAARHGHEGLAGRLFVEVGGNIGTTTLQAAREAARCVVIEPEPGNVALLRANVAVNGLSDCVDVVAAAAGATPGTVLMALSGANHGDHRVSDDGDVSVPAVRLDDVLAERGIEAANVGLLWMDTQGFEAQVLAGAPKLLAAAPFAVTEFWPSLLRERGDLDMFGDLIGKAWSNVVDLHGPAGMPEDLDYITARYPDGFTDLLLIP
jgi:FkbM family methyltransferase